MVVVVSFDIVLVLVANTTTAGPECHFDARSRSTSTFCVAETDRRPRMRPGVGELSEKESDVGDGKA